MMVKNIQLRAVSIGDSLEAACKRDASGSYWLLDSRTADESIYKGNSGINLFFQELYLCTGNTRYLRLVEDNLRWLIEKTRVPTNDHSLFNGRAGVAHCLIMAHRITSKKKYIIAARNICRQSLDFLKSNDRNVDILGGAPGTLLVLCRLYLLMPEPWIIEFIRTGLSSIIRSIEFSKEGPYWNRSAYFIRGLCGLSHGSSGIAFMFFELYRFFGERQFLKMSEALINYESRLFKKEFGNWPYSMVTFEDGLGILDLYKKKNASEFTDKYDSVAWCHGAPGIGIVRAQLFNEFSGDVIKREIRAAYKTTLGSLRRATASHCLCHGLTGNFFLFIYMHRRSLLTQKEYEDLQERALQTLENQKLISGNYWTGGVQTSGEDLGLFTGLAGIGYFYTQLLHTSDDTILLPQLPAGKKLSKTPSKFDLSLHIASRIFPRLIAALDKLKLLPALMRSCGDTVVPDEIVKHTKTFLKKKRKEPLTLLMSFELSIYKMGRAVSNNFLATVKRLQLLDAAKQLVPRLANNDDIQLVINPTITLKKTNYELKSIVNDPLNPACGQFYYVLFHGANVEEFAMSASSFTILGLFRSPESMRGILRMFDSTSPGSVQMIREQVYSFVRSTFIIEVNNESRS